MIEAPGRLFHIAMDAGAFQPLGAIPALASNLLAQVDFYHHLPERRLLLAVELYANHDLLKISPLTS